MPIDPEAMPSRDTGEVITGSLSCPRCGYELRGLKAGGVCPECGAAIRKKSKRFVDNLTDAPRWYLLTIGMGTTALLASAMVSMFFAALVAYRDYQFAPLPGGMVVAVSLGLVSAWLGGVFAVTVSRPLSDKIGRDVILESRPLRHGSRIGAGVPVLAVLITSAAAATGFGWLFAIAGLVSLAGLFGLVPLCVYLSSLADWAGDTKCGDRLRAAAWVLVVCGGGAIVFGLLAMANTPFVFIPLILCILITIGAVFAFVLSVGQLATASLWAIQNASAATAREIRIAERKRQESAEADARREAELARAEAGLRPSRAPTHDPESDVPIPLSGLEDDDPRAQQRDREIDDALGTSTPRSRGHNVIEQSGSEGYGLAPEDDHTGR